MIQVFKSYLHKRQLNKKFKSYPAARAALTKTMCGFAVFALYFGPIAQCYSLIQLYENY